MFCVPQSVKTKETYPTRPGSPTPCNQGLRRGYFIIVQQTNTFPLMALNRLIKVTADSIATESPSLSASSFSNSPFCCEYIVDNHDVNRNELSSVLQKMIKDLHL